LGNTARRSLVASVSAVLLVGFFASLSAQPGSALSIDASFDFAIDLEALDVLFDAEFEASLVLDAWTACVSTEIDEGAWDEQAIELEVKTSGVTLSSVLRLEPDKDRLKDWKTKLEVERSDWEMTVEGKLTRTRRWFTLSASHSDEALPIEVDGRIRFRATKPTGGLRFYDLDIGLETSLGGVEVDLEIECSPTGFEEANLALGDLSVERLRWLTFDLEVERSPSERTIELECHAALGEIGCLRVEAASTEATSLLPLLITEIELEGEISGAEIEIEVLLDPDEWIDDRYAYRLVLKTENETPTGRDLETTVEFLWSDTPSAGFLPDRLDAEAAFEVTDTLDVSVRFEIVRTPTPSASIVLHFEYAK